MIVSIDAAGMVRGIAGADWASRYHIGQAGRVLALTHAAVLGRARREDPAAMMDAFLRRAENREGTPISETIARASKDVRSVGCSAADPLTRTSLAAVVFDGPHVAVANIGDSRVYVVRAGSVALLEAQQTVYSVASEDTFLLCTAGVWASISPAGLARVVARGRNAESTLAGIAAFSPQSARFTAILARVGSVSEQATSREDEERKDAR